MGNDVAIASSLRGELLPDGFPAAGDWWSAAPIAFCADWQGRNHDPSRETEVRLLWSPEELFLQFRARYREITVFPDCDPGGRRDFMWNRDVAEAFLQPAPSFPRKYFEFEVSPNSYWIDLAIDLDSAELKKDISSGLRRKATIDERNRLWTAEMAIPLRTFGTRVQPKTAWRANFFRIEGPAEPRFYSAWRPTGTERPNFHVPTAFGTLLFQ